MRNDIFLSDELQTIIDNRAKAIGLTTSAFITDLLENAFRDELTGIADKSYSTLYSELKVSAREYINSLSPGDSFTLRDVPYYKDMGIAGVVTTHIVPAAIRARLGRSFNNEVSSSTGDFSDVKRATTRSGKLAFKKVDGSSAAVYVKL